MSQNKIWIPFWLQNDFQNAHKKYSKIILSWKRDFLTPVSREIYVFDIQDLPKMTLKTIQKSILKADPLKLVHFGVLEALRQK